LQIFKTSAKAGYVPGNKSCLTPMVPAWDMAINLVSFLGSAVQAGFRTNKLKQEHVDMLSSPGDVVDCILLCCSTPDLVGAKVCLKALYKLCSVDALLAACNRDNKVGDAVRKLAEHDVLRNAASKVAKLVESAQQAAATKPSERASI
jgi:hypothetical protein